MKDKDGYAVGQDQIYMKWTGVRHGGRRFETDSPKISPEGPKA